MAAENNLEEMAMSIDDPNGTVDRPNSPSSELRDKASHDLNEVTSRAKEDLDSITQKAAADARDLGHQAQEKLGEATDKAKTFAASQKDLAASQINGVAGAVLKVAEELEGSDQQSVARYARDLANGLSNVGKQIETRDVDDLMSAAQDFGRNQPVAFLGVAALAGFVASRFALASTHRRETQDTKETNTSSSTQAYRPNAASINTTTRPEDQTGGL